MYRLNLFRYHNNLRCLLINSNQARFQVANTSAGVELSFVVRLTDDTDATLDGLIIQNHTNGKGIVTEDGAIQNIRNTILYSLNLGTASEGIHALNTTTVNIDNCIINNFDDGVERDDNATVTVENSAVYNINNDEFDGTMTVNYCASDDSRSGTGNFNPTFANEFVDENGPDWNLLADTADCYDSGTDLSGTFTTDIEGTTRTLRASTAWSVGVFDEVPGDPPSGATIPVFIKHYRNQGQL